MVDLCRSVHAVFDILYKHIRLVFITIVLYCAIFYITLAVLTYRSDKKLHSTPGYCRNIPHSRPPENLTESIEWQPGSSHRESFVYSAHYDPRLWPTVKVIAMANMLSPYIGLQLKYCQVWFLNDPDVHIVPTELQSFGEDHQRKFTVVMYTCNLQNETRVPYAVSLVFDPCQSPDNVLKVVNSTHITRPEVNFTVCVSPLNSEYGDHNQLVDTIELNRILGAGRFQFYNHSLERHTSRYLRSYVDEGLAEVIQWTVPVATDLYPRVEGSLIEIHYFAQLAALNDCLYRHMFHSKFIVFTDMDEIIVPYLKTNWMDMLDDLKKKSKNDALKGGYLFRNVFFGLEFPDDEEMMNDTQVTHLRLNTLLKTKRSTRVFSVGHRSKMIIKSQMVSSVGIHAVSEFLNLTLWSTSVSETDGLLHHYRVDHIDPISETLVTDKSTHRFKDLLVARAADRRYKIMGTQK